VDARQALRLRRFGLATLSYVLATALTSIAWAFGALPASAVLEVALAFFAINAGLYALIRSGLNLRFQDPSLTRFQIVAAISVLMYIVYNMNEGREVALFGCFVVFLFGIFRLTSREFVVLTLYTLAMYALVINLLMHFRPAAIPRITNEWMAWLGLAGFLPCFTIIGEQINQLRIRMRQSEARFQRLTEMTSDFFWETDAEHRLRERRSFDLGSRRGSPFHQPPRVGQTRWEAPSLSPDKAGWEAHRNVLDARLSFRNFELSRLASDGTERHISISGDPEFDARGGFQGYFGVGTDITQRKRAELAFRESAHSLRLFADNIPAMTESWDKQLRCRFANRAFAEFFGLSVEDILGRHLREVLGEAVFREIEGHFALALLGHPIVYERTRILADGQVRYLQVKLLPDKDDEGTILGCFSVTTDITEHKLAEERIQRVAHHDSLTGLPNRLLFNDRLNQVLVGARRDARPFALLYLDLNRFKPVNDTLGHDAGDELLKEAAGRIRQQVRESDTVARVGGDEFTVILPYIAGREEARLVAAKIVAALAIPFELGEPMREVQIGISIGIAVYPVDARDAETLIKAADSSMYADKQKGVPAYAT
jgi:diguanylate cyclase (GGDEF)-like protein/PAS domain S-box-containing protein